MLRTQYEDKSCFTILAILRADLDYKNLFHKDHLHPASRFKSKAVLEKAGIGAADVDLYRDADNWNSIINLSHLDGKENQSKGSSSLAEWTSKESKRRNVPLSKLCSDLLLPPEPSLLDFDQFPGFIHERRRILSDRLREVLS